jgi:hypothetical protein
MSYWAYGLFAIERGQSLSGGCLINQKRVTMAPEFEQISPIKQSSGVRTDLMYSALTFEAFTPRRVMKLGLDLMSQSAAAIRVLAPWPEIRLASLEFQNKVETFDLFEHVDATVHIPAGGEVRLPNLIEQIKNLDTFRAVWANEGLGHYVAEMVWQQCGPPRNLLTDETDELPGNTLAALHAGLGLSFANRALKAIASKTDKSEIRRALDQFFALCRDNSKAGYAEAAYEALGLTARNLYPHLVPAVDQQLSEMGEDLRGYFWHGVGRAIYFAPTNALPDGHSSARELKMTFAEPPDETGRRNALAGLAWALTLVNIRHPDVLEGFLRRHRDQLIHDEAFANGVGSSVLIWRDSTGDRPPLTTFCKFEPDDPEMSACWEQLVGRPCRDALNHYVNLKKHRALGEVFRYRDLAALAREWVNDDSTV